jgi:saccharopine dehydrogenase-like NADP-dependent oxidoreductase
MSRVLLIGAGGVAGVAAAKMAQNPDPFMAELNVQGLPWQETFDPVMVP